MSHNQVHSRRSIPAQGKPIIVSRFALICFLLFTLCMNSVHVSAKQLYTTDGVHVRSQPNSSSEICTTLEKGTAVTKTGTSGNWIKIQADGVSGYIYKDYLSSDGLSSESTSKDSTSSGTSSSTSYINSTEVNLRKKANSHCKIKAVLEKGETVSILSHSGNWTKIQREDGTSGYVYSIYLGAGKSSDTSSESTVSRADVISEYRSDAISYAKTRLGDSYSQDLRDTDGYADCSSLVRDAYKNATGISIGNTTTTQADQMEDYFYSISKITDATRGDLLYHLSDDNHVGIYLGNGKVLQASQKSGCVKISTYDSNTSYWEYGCNAAAYCYDHS
ncbi:MAG: SH3 domain-containing protein [Clostridiales bacterium]|nr:SH3 domain-containing protein [Clostridiales bacterium]